MTRRAGRGDATRRLFLLMLLPAGLAAAWVGATLPPAVRIAIAVEGDAPGTSRVPAAAILPPARPATDGPQTARVWVVEKERARPRDIRLEDPPGGAMRVLRGLGGGEAVILDPPPGLRDGGLVRLRP